MIYKQQQRPYLHHPFDITSTMTSSGGGGGEGRHWWYLGLAAGKASEVALGATREAAAQLFSTSGVRIGSKFSLVS